ncbi:MAG: FAD-dependent oxidoreductase [Actinomycetota bacterium]|nr:FAD-dependent oxidoreductase [Actinomycetota bacterium]
MRVAIVGTGVAGLTAAHLLAPRHQLTVFEQDRRPGGHVRTLRVDLADETHAVDTGFIVYNERCYPGFTRLLRRLGVATKPSEMSFSMSDEASGVEWRGTSATTLFAQRRNLLRPQLYRMARDVVRFRRVARRLLEAAGPAGGRAAGPAGGASTVTLGALVEQEGLSRELVDWYLVPLGSAIWSAAPDRLLEFPAATVARFFDNHGLLSVGDQPEWRTVDGGAARYVEAILAPLGRRVRLGTPVRLLRRAGDGVEVVTDGGRERFDHVVVATHSDEALALLEQPVGAEKEVLGAIAYQPNRAVLHTDASVLPRTARARASWNYFRPAQRSRSATLTYDLVRLQSIRSRHALCVTLNRPEAIADEHVLAELDFAHPVLDAAAVAAQARHGEISGRQRISYAGAYWGYGFHEDGVQSALRVCAALGVGW